MSPLVVALSALNASNYVFHVVVSRLLGPRSYGALASLLAVLLVLSVPFGVVQTVVAKRATQLRTSGRRDQVERLAVSATKLATWVAIGCLGALAALGPALGSFLHVGVLPAELLGPYVVLSLVLSVPLGVLQGMLRFGAYAWVSVVGAAARLALGVVLVRAGLGVPGAVLASVACQAASLLLALWAIRLTPRAWRSARATTELLRRGFGHTALSLVGFWLLAELDLVLSRHYLPSRQAGYYAAAGLAARALLFLPGAVAIAAFPFFADRSDLGKTAARWLRLSLVATLALVAAPLAGLVLLRTLAVSLTFGRGFLPAAGLLPVLAPAMGLLGVANLLVFFHIACGTRAHVFLYLAAAVEVVAVALDHATPGAVALIVLFVAAAVALLLGHAAIAVGRWVPVAERGPAGPESTASVGPVEQAADGRPPEVSVVLPCHNAGPGLRAVLAEVLGTLPPGSEVIVVSDGSTDASVQVAREFAGAGVRILEYPERCGKGHALRVGLAEARGDSIAFMDADGDIAPESLRAFLAIAETYRPDIVLGSKRHPLSEVSYPPLRRLVSWGYQQLVRTLFRIGVRDTQTGLKLVRREVVAAVLPHMLEKRFAFDLEFLVVARLLGYRRVFEAPVRIDYRFTSHVDPRAVARTLVDTLAIFYRRYVLDTYRPNPAESAEQRPGARRRVVSARDRLRILVLNWRDSDNPAAGGAETFTHEVTRRWASDGHDVTLLTSRFAGSAAVEDADGVRVRRIGHLRTGTLYLLAQKELAWLRGFDVIIDEINTIPFLTPLWRRRLPPVMGFIHQLAADVWDAEVPAPIAAIGRRVEPALLRLYRDVPMATVSRSTRDDLRGMGFRDVALVPEGCDSPRGLTAVAKEARPTLLFVGRLAANKRPDHAVAALRHVQEDLPDARLWIVGRGPEERRLRASLPAGAELLGFLPREELYARMARAHCLVVPSVREGWGLVVSEANAVGTPAVGYDVAGIRDSIRHGRTGLLAAAGDPEDLARQCATLLGDPPLYEAMCRRARQSARWFSWESTAEELMSVVREVAVGGAV